MIQSNTYSEIAAAHSSYGGIITRCSFGYRNLTSLYTYGLVSSITGDPITLYPTGIQVRRRIGPTLQFKEHVPGTIVYLSFAINLYLYK